MTCNNVWCCHNNRRFGLPTALVNVNMVAYGKINSRLSPVLIINRRADLFIPWLLLAAYVRKFLRDSLGGARSKLSWGSFGNNRTGTQTQYVVVSNEITSWCFDYKRTLHDKTAGEYAWTTPCPAQNADKHPVTPYTRPFLIAKWQWLSLCYTYSFTASASR